MNLRENDYPGHAVFRTTHWTMVLQAAQTEGETGSFSELYRHYWFPLYTYVRRRGFSTAEAEDLTQDFFVRLLEKRSLNGLEREGGRFRSFLLRALENFLANEWDRMQAQKRGAGQRPISMHTEEAEARLALVPAEGGTPERIYERQWAFTLLERVTQSLRAQYIADGRRELFDQLRVYLQGDRNGTPYSEVAARRGMTEGAVKVAVHRMRQQYGELLRQEIGRTVSNDGEVDEELRHLIEVVGE